MAGGGALRSILPEYAALELKLGSSLEVGWRRLVPLRIPFFLWRVAFGKACFLVCTLDVPSFGPSLVCFSGKGEEGALLVAFSVGVVRVSTGVQRVLVRRPRL